MLGPVSLVTLLTTSFVGALGLSWLVVRLARPFRAPVAPTPGSVLRLRTDSGIYRSRFLGVGDSGWRISAPLQRDRFVPLRIGGRVLAEMSCGGGALVFRTSIAARDGDSHELVLMPPSNSHHVERRQHARRFGDSARVAVDGEAAELLDVSAGGVRVRTPRPLRRGDRVRLDLASEEVYAWVLGAEGTTARLVFEP